MESKQSQASRPKSLCQKIGEEESDDDEITSQENVSIDLNRRRHAINITDNPGYRVRFFRRIFQWLEPLSSHYIFGKWSKYR